MKKPFKTYDRFISSLVMVGVLLLTYFDGKGQDLVKTMKELSTQMDQAENLHIKADFKVFNTETREVLLKDKAEIKRKSGAFYKNLGRQEILSTEQSYITTDHQAKMIYYSSVANDGEQNVVNTSDFLPSVDSLLNLYLEYTYLGNKEGVKTYVVTPKIQWLKSMELQFDSDDRLHKILYEYDASVYGVPYSVEVNYTLFDLNAHFNSTDFSEVKFITRRGNLVQPATALTGYRITQ